MDLTLIGWLLLFLSKCLDHVTAMPSFEAGQSGAKSGATGGGGGAKHDYHSMIQNRLVSSHI